MGDSTNAPKPCQCCDDLPRLQAELARLTVERDAARATLARYGTHRPGCLAWLLTLPRSQCDCGLSAVLEEK